MLIINGNTLHIQGDWGKNTEIKACAIPYTDVRRNVAFITFYTSLLAALNC